MVLELSRKSAIGQSHKATILDYVGSGMHDGPIIILAYKFELKLN